MIIMMMIMIRMMMMIKRMIPFFLSNLISFRHSTIQLVQHCPAICHDDNEDDIDDISMIILK